MADRNELARLYAKSKKVLIGGKVEVEVTPLGPDELSEFSGSSDLPEDKKLQFMDKMIALSIGNTEEEVKPLSLGAKMELLDVILEINELNDASELSDKLKTMINKNKKQ